MCIGRYVARSYERHAISATAYLPMFGTLTAAPGEPLLGRPQGPLKLRLRGGGRRGQLLQLHSAKVAIGSSPQSTLRLRFPGIAPMHCLIVRGQQQTLIRRLSGDTRLNDSTFDDAILRTGDRLGIGNVELEVVDDETRSAISDADAFISPESIATPESISALPLAAIPVAVDATVAKSTALPAPIDANLIQAMEQMAANLTAVTHQSRRRARLLIHELRSVRKRNQELEQLQTSRKDEDREIDRRWAQLENDIQTFVDQRQRWQEVRAQNERLLVWRRGQLEEQSRNAAAEQQALANDRATLEEQQRLVAQQMAELDRQRAALDDDRHQWREAEERQKTALDQKASQLDAQASELARQAQQLAATESRLTTGASNQAAEIAELSTLRQQLESERQSWESQRLEWDTKQAAATAAGEQLDADRQAWDNQKAAWEAEHTRQSTELEANRLQLEQAQTALTEQHAELAKRQVELAENQAEFAKNQAAITEQQTDAEKKQREFQSLETQIEAERRALAEERGNFESRRQALETEAQQHRAAATESESQLSRLTDALEKSKAALSEQQTQWETERTQQENALKNRQEELDRRAAEMESERQQWLLDRETSAAHDQPTVAESAAIEPAKIPSPSVAADDERPTTSADNEVDPAANPAATASDEDEVFARLRALSLLKKDDGAAAKSDSAERSVSAPLKTPESVTSNRATPLDEPAEPAAEESVDDYMARLLQRMRGIADEGAAPAKGTTKGDRQPPARPQPPPETPTQKAVGDSSVVAKKLLKLEPRKVAPEKSGGLAAMREIANLSARSAIATHHHRRGASRAWSNMIVGLVGLGCGVWLLMQSPETDSPYFYGGLMGLVVSLYWFAKARLLARSVRSFQRHHEQQFAAISREQQAATSPASNADEKSVAAADSSDPAKA
jgi:hypothetical protein